MSLARTNAVALIGVTGRLVEVEADLSPGLPGLTFTGLPDVAVTESRERVRSAVLNSGLTWPSKRITVALLPADVRKNGSMFDLALALAILAATGEIAAAGICEGVWLGELGLDGRLRPVRGVLPAVIAAKDAGISRVVVPKANGSEAALVEGIEVFTASSLREVVLATKQDGPPLARARSSEPGADDDGPDLADVVGQPIARRALEIAAAGAHHLLMSGSPGAGKTMLAARLPGILPRLDDASGLEVTAIYSVAGLLGPGTALVRRPPLQAPHHTSSMAALVGGGSGLARPGAATLAHRGVLVLDEAAEFSPRVLDSLRQPLESGRIVLHRTGGSVEYPARFQLVLATNPCPCSSPKARECLCTPDARRRYGQRLSGPLTDRIDLQIAVDPVTRADLMDDATPREPSAPVAARVRRARLAAEDRWSAQGWTTNAEVPGPVLRRRPWRPSRSALAPLDAELDRGGLSARGCDRVLKLAWTLTDLAGKNSPSLEEISEAVWLRTGRAGVMGT
ncbi:YifB family Mg chelatase-like AAA ATPase [Jatrophihabitans sp. DSM 45814]